MSDLGQDAELFALGRVLITRGVEDLVPAQRAIACLKRHSRGEWGDVPEEDRELNQQALRMSGRLMSVYPIDSTRPGAADNVFWIITEADRSATTLLLPDEY